MYQRHGTSAAANGPIPGSPRPGALPPATAQAPMLGVRWTLPVPEERVRGGTRPTVSAASVALEMTPLKCDRISVST